MILCFCLLCKFCAVVKLWLITYSCWPASCSQGHMDLKYSFQLATIVLYNDSAIEVSRVDDICYCNLHLQDMNFVNFYRVYLCVGVTMHIVPVR